MIKLLVLYLHLIATCIAIGSILATDLRLVLRLRAPGFRLAPPNRFVVQLVTGSLILLWVTGACLLAIGVGERSDFLHNPKLQGKLLLVGALTLNAAALHLYAFRWLQGGRRIDLFTLRGSVGIAMPIAVSNALWLYCAFLGIARTWNDAVPLTQVLGIAVVLTVSAWAVVMLALACSSNIASAAPTRGSSRRRVVRTAATAQLGRAEPMLPSVIGEIAPVRQTRAESAARTRSLSAHR